MNLNIMFIVAAIAVAAVAFPVLIGTQVAVRVIVQIFQCY